MLHIFGYIFEITSFITGTLIRIEQDDSYSTTPFTMNNWMVFGFWIYLIVHFSTFLPIIFSNSLTSLDLVCE
jgi:hypothetical protein